MDWKTDIAKDARTKKVSRAFTIRPDQADWLKAQKGNSSAIVRYALDRLIEAVEMGDQLVGGE